MTTEESRSSNVERLELEYAQNKGEITKTALSRLRTIHSELRGLRGFRSVITRLEFVIKVLNAKFSIPVTTADLSSTWDENYDLPLAIYYPAHMIYEIAELAQVPPPVAVIGNIEWRAYVNALAEKARFCMEAGLKAAEERKDIFDESAAQVLGEHLDEEYIRDRLGEIESTAQKVQETAQDVAEAAGIAADGSLSQHFDSYAKAERRSANTTRYGAIITSVAITAFAFQVLRSVDANFTWLDLVRKVAITIPALALAAYLAHESSRHRMIANWAATIAVQLKSIKAYTDSLSPESRERIRMEFGERIFTQPSPTPTKDAPLNIPALVERGKELISDKKN